MNQKDYLTLTRTFALKTGVPVENLRKDFPFKICELYEQLEEDLKEFELVFKSHPNYEGEDVPGMYDDE